MSTISIALGGFVAMAWTALAIRLIRLSRGESFRFLGPIAGTTKTTATVDAIVPARDEEANVERTVRALRAQEYPGLSIMVVDDQSTDSTAAIVGRLAEPADGQVPLKVIRGSERPEGWVGKTWAVHQGAREASGDWLWFVDADMGLHPRALATALAEADRAGADLVSLLPGVRCETFWQGAIASAFLQLLGQLYPLDRVNDPSRPEAIAAGGFLLIRRDAYEKAGGHEAVRREIVEDIQLAKRVKGSGRKLLVRLAPSLAWTHMYGSFGDIWRGLRKNAYAGMDYLPHKYVTGAIVALMMGWVPWVTLGVGVGGSSLDLISVGAWGIVGQVAATLPILVFLRLTVGFALTLPLGISAYVAIATSSVWHHHRGRILWKGRTIPSGVVATPADGPAKSTDGSSLGSSPRN